MKIKDIKKININPDEILLVKVPNEIRCSEIDKIRDFFHSRNITNVLMYTNGISFTKVTKKDNRTIQERALAYGLDSESIARAYQMPLHLFPDKKDVSKINLSDQIKRQNIENNLGDFKEEIDYQFCCQCGDKIVDGAIEVHHVRTCTKCLERRSNEKS